ncbi:MAG: hypothetical protein M0P35_07300 [Bacteroidales bacterium]|jgi:hypothetical protein|nr:hypothetical protein [Bacteroidales bacterium]
MIITIIIAIIVAVITILSLRYKKHKPQPATMVNVTCLDVTEMFKNVPTIDAAGLERLKKSFSNFRAALEKEGQFDAYMNFLEKTKQEILATRNN